MKRVGDHQSQEIAGLEDGLRNHDCERNAQQAESVVGGHADRNRHQKRDNQQQELGAEHDTRHESHDR